MSVASTGGHESGLNAGDAVARASDVTSVQATNVAGSVRVNPIHSIVVELCEIVESSQAAIATAERRTAAAEAEVEHLRARVGELETWLETSAQFDQVEHVQLGRVLALASAEREARRLPWLVSIRFVAVAVYVAIAGVFVLTLFGAHV